MELEQEYQREYSVTRPQDNDQPPYMQFIFPAQLWGDLSGELLPNVLPAYQWYGFYKPRDIILLSTIQFEPEGWGAAVGKACAKVAAQSWDVTSDVPLRAKRMKDMLSSAGHGLGLFGWQGFVATLTESYLLTGMAFIEIERDRLGRVVNIHALNPLRCRLTNSAEHPVSYLKTSGEEVRLHRETVEVITDTPSATQGEFGIVSSAAARAFSAIVRMNSANWYTIEKVKGTRPLSISFVQGVAPSQLDDGIKAAKVDAAAKNLNAFMGAAVIPVQTDLPLTVVEIPLASLPDKFNIDEERRWSGLVYANSIGLDPQDLNPALLASGSIGTGTQALVLAEAAKGNSLRVFSKKLTTFINRLDSKVEFNFDELDYSDAEKREQIKQKRAQTIKIYTDAGWITANQALNMLVDEGDVPDAFLTIDETEEVRIEDDENPDATSNKPKEPDTGAPETEGETTQKQLPFLLTEKTVAEDVIETPERDQFARIIGDITRRQFQDTAVDSILRDIGKEALEDVRAADIEPIVARHMPPLEPDDDEEMALIALLLFAAAFALRSVPSAGAITETEINASVQRQAGERLANLISGIQTEGYTMSPPSISNPNLPDGKSLWTGGVTIMAIMIAGAISAIIGRSERVTYTAVEKEIESEMDKRAKERGEAVANTELARITAVALYAYARATAAQTKTWLRTQSREPRESHLAMVGETVPIDGYFSDGSFWSNELPNCKCGIRLGYK
ncbi:MAG: hypothetical protein KDD89_00380 [Anaerolineales bacterium]|nr:hypothetical protein [Anaerolineales bacterium]